ncbi:MAG: type IV secretory system conjugative DNA transfer family protein [Bacilli bacterium]|nr:type IV secretory system conjugative DNA transfer family protein [Bacilli bacterium]
MKHNYRYLNYVGDREFENRFATEEEMKSKLTKVDISDPNASVKSAGLPLISDTKTIYCDTEDYHSLILGSTGSMKSRTLIFPTIFSLGLAGESMLVADPKGELYARTSGFLKEKGYELNVINLRDMANSDCWNPLEEAYVQFHNGEEEAGLNLAHEFVNAITSRLQDAKSPSWSIAARQLLDGLVELMIRGAKDPSECNPGSLSTLLDRVKLADKSPTGSSSSWFDDDDEDVRTLLQFVNDLPEGCSLKNNLFSAVNMTKSATTTLAGVLDVAYGSVTAFTSSRSLMALTSHTSFDIHAIGRGGKPHAVFMIVPDEDSTYNFIVTSFIKQVYTAMVKEAFRQGGTLPRRLNFVLDEFANLPFIADMPSMITAARSRNMRFFLVVQSDNQLHATYKDDAETIKTNCLNWVYLSTKEDQLIQQVQRMVGVRGNGSNEPLITYQQLSSMRKVVGAKGGAEALILMHRSRPYVSFMPDISRYTQFLTKEAVPFPKMDGEYHFFDLTERVLKMDKDLANKVFGGLKAFKEPEPEEDIEIEDPDSDVEEPEEPKKPEGKGGKGDKDPFADLLKKLDEIADPDDD